MANKAKIKPNTHKIISKNVSKNIRYKIPKDILKNTLEILKNDTSFERKSCQKYIHEYDKNKRELIKCSFDTIIYLGRKCVQERDWIGLGKILSISKPMRSFDLTKYSPIYLKYAALFLKNVNNPDLKNAFLTNICKCTEEKFWNIMQRLK